MKAKLSVKSGRSKQKNENFFCSSAICLQKQIEDKCEAKNFFTFDKDN